MRIVVIGGTGLIGSKVVHTLTEHGHDAVAAAPSTGVNTVTGEGLSDVLAGASVVVDVSNSPSFRRRGDRVLPQVDHEPAHRRGRCRCRPPCRAVGGRHRSLGPAERVLPGEAGAGEAHQRRARFRTPSCTRRSSSSSSTSSPTPRPRATRCVCRRRSVQPMAAADVAKAVAIAAVGEPVNGISEVGGPQAYPLPDLIRTALTARGDTREVVADPAAQYWGVDNRRTHPRSR